MIKCKNQRFYPLELLNSLVYSMVYLDRFAISIFENRGLDFERAKIQPPIFASGPSVSGPGILGGYGLTF